MAARAIPVEANSSARNLTVMRTTLTPCFLLLLLGLFATRATALELDDRPTTPTTRTVEGKASLLVTAQSLLGRAIPGAVFIVKGRNNFAAEITTSELGQASLQLPREHTWENLEVSLGGTSFGIANVRRVASRKGNRLLIFFELYVNDVMAMTTEERRAFIQMLPKIYEDRRMAGALDAESTNPHPLRLSALLLARRAQLEPWGYQPSPEEDLVSPQKSSESIDTAPVPRIRVRVVDRFGQPVAARVVELYRLDGATGAVGLADRGRSNASGAISFNRLQAGSFYRVLVPQDQDELIARSPILFLDGDDSLDADVLVLREEGQTLSGIVTFLEKPLPMTTVTATLPGGTELSTTTDRFGYFEIGPIEPGLINVTLSRRDSRDAPVEFRVDSGPEEVILPFNALALPAAE